MKALFPGSFDPIHNGHVEVIKAAAEKFERLYIFVASNETKNHVRTLKFRTQLVQKVIDSLELDNVIVIQQQPGTLTPKVAEKLDVEVIVRGIRGYENKEEKNYEASLAESYLDVNPKLSFEYFIVEYLNISSSEVNEAIKKFNSIKEMVPEVVEKDILLECFEPSKKKKGKLVIFCGPSGSGKGTVSKEFLSIPEFDFHFSVSATTREMREGEVDGVH